LPPFVTAESVPALEPSVTVPPEVARLFPYASLACTVTVAEEVPLAASDCGEAVPVVVAGEAGPGIAVIAPLVPARLVLSVAVTV
jgi:hypothetical protein